MRIHDKKRFLCLAAWLCATVAAPLSAVHAAEKFTSVVPDAKGLPHPALADPKNYQCSPIDLKAKPAPSGIPPRIGSIDQMLFSPVNVVLGDLGPKSTAFGTPYQDFWFDAMLRNDKGEFFYVVRGDRAREPKLERVVVATGTKLDKDGYMLIDRAFSEIEYKPTDAKDRLVLSNVNPNDPHAEMTITEKTLAWKQEGLIDIKGDIIGGMQMTFPVRRDKAGTQTYVQVQSAVEGTVLGQHMTGFMVLEHNYDTVTWMESVAASGVGGWVAFTNLFADGSSERGLVYCGGALRGAVVVDGKGKELLNTNLVNGHNTVDDGGWLKESTYSFGDGSQWKYVTDSHAVMPRSTSEYWASFVFGSFRRVGDTRKPIRSWAWSIAGKTS